jgi:putative transcriptional regulator
LFRGGPVEGPLLAIHKHSSWGEWEVLPGIFLSSRKELLDKLVKSDEPLRVFTGYSGWAAGQLERELELGGWLTTLATAEEIFSDPLTLWKRIADRIGREIMRPVFRRKPVPADTHWWN